VSDSLTEVRAGPARSQLQRLLAGIVALAVVVGLWIANDALFAAPIAAVTKVAGAWVAFVLFAGVYSLGGFILALLALRAYERYSRGEPSRLALWLERQAASPRVRWARPLAQGGRVVGFVVASVVAGGVVTTWLIRYSGQRERLVAIAAASSIIFGVTFAATYAGLFNFVL
jgi:hypothetical protein